MESLQLHRWNRKLSFFNKLCISEHSHYLFKLIFSRSSGYVTRNKDNILFFKKRHTFFKKLSSSTIIESNKFDPIIRNSTSFNIFTKSILEFIRPSANSFLNSHNHKGIKFITRLLLGLSHLWERKFKHSSQEFLNSFCNCGFDIESTAHSLLHCPTYITEDVLSSTP